MPPLAAWDTNLISRATPGSTAARFVLDRAAEGDPVTVPSIAYAETVEGFERARRRGTVTPSLTAAHGWLRARVAAGDVEVLPLDAPAALVLGIVGAQRPDASRRWHRDVAIAATAWTAGRGIATHNRRDFEEIAGLIAAHVDPEHPLEVVASPVQA